MSQAINTFQVNLMKGTGTGTITWTRLVEIKDFPDLIGQPEALEKTTTSDPQRTYIEGILGNDQKTFTCNYNPTDYATIEALEGQIVDLAVWFGATKSGTTYTPDGSMGKFQGKGYVRAGIPGKGVNEVVDMTVTVTLTEGFTKVSA